MDTFTINTNKIPVSKNDFNKILMEKMSPFLSEYLSNFGILTDELKALCKEQESLYIMNGDIYINTKLMIAMPDFETYQMQDVDSVTDFDYESFLGENKVIKGHVTELPTLKQIRAISSILGTFFSQNNSFVCICDDARLATYKDLEVAYNPFTEKVGLESDFDVVNIFPICNLESRNTVELLKYYLVPFGLCPEGLTNDAMLRLSDLIFLKICNRDYVDYETEESIKFNGGKILRDFINNPTDKVLEELHWELTTILKQYMETRNIGDVELDTREELLNCEKIRADIEPYEERILTDPNRGHWDLWVNQSSDNYTVEVPDSYMARNPICDINQNGVIAIDFGTKSTIVVYQSDIEHSLPMGIGDGNLSKEPTPKRYENPTVMHFVNLEKFLNNYASRSGRPKTKWEDLTISHTAMEQFSNSKSDEYYEYMHQIKQWAGQREKQFRIQSHAGNTYVLPAFLDVSDDDWNPIELYAYYIGLYINNMRKGHGIFLDYYLSFPVTYETRIREKIVKSFEKGIKKSLPASILSNEEEMKRFHVNGDISEPAAYAVCALQEYGFEPDEDEEIFYSIFDFGGGTTDFDFGLWKQSAKRRYDYTIENFGAGGDEYLGGENLLEMLAFEVFKANQTLMREKKYTFTLAPKCTEFLGSDSLLADSQEAEKNMHNLMEKLRPYWETKKENIEQKENEKDVVAEMIALIGKKIISHPRATAIEKELDIIARNQEELEEDDQIVIGYLVDLAERYGIDLEEENDDTIKFIVTLFDKEGKDQANETLYFSKKQLDNLIETRIREGVNNFFSALLLSYQNEKVKKPTTVNILLAGNSCKSPVVKRVFEEEINAYEKQVKEKYQIGGDTGKLFEIFPPLGTDEAYEKMESRGISVVRNDFEKPTGKTGVAFGLIQCRAGGVIERISNIGIDDEIPFQYFIGWRSKKKFVLFKDDEKITKYKGKPDYNTWYKFIEADDTVFDLYYTTLPECISGELVVDGNAAVKRLRCDVDVVDENAFVYIRATDPHTLEYVVASSSDVEKSMLGKVIRKEL